jgi:hypothetical protein
MSVGVRHRGRRVRARRRGAQAGVVQRTAAATQALRGEVARVDSGTSRLPACRTAPHSAHDTHSVWQHPPPPPKHTHAHAHANAHALHPAAAAAHHDAAHAHTHSTHTHTFIHTHIHTHTHTRTQHTAHTAPAAAQRLACVPPHMPAHYGTAAPHMCERSRSLLTLPASLRSASTHTPATSPLLMLPIRDSSLASTSARVVWRAARGARAVGRCDGVCDAGVTTRVRALSCDR